MRKKLLSSILIITMLASALTGCGKEKEAPVLEEEMSYMIFDACGFSSGSINFSEDETGKSNVEQTVSMDVEAFPGETIGDALDRWGAKYMEPFGEGDVFEGWMECELDITIDEEGFSKYSYGEIFGDVLISTEELKKLTVPEGEVLYLAKWESMSMEDYEEYISMFEEPDEEDVYDVEHLMLIDSNGGLIGFGAEEPFETDAYIYYVKEGFTFGEIMNKNDAPVISVSKEGSEFAGWKIYEGTFIEWVDEKPETLEEGLEYFTGGKYFAMTMKDVSVHRESISTEELGEILIGQNSYYVTAVWK